MYVAVIPNRGSPPAILLRESYREAGKTKNRTLANLSRWPAERIEQLRAVLHGDRLLPAAEAVEIVRAPPPAGWRAAALRCQLHLSRRPLRRTGAAWLQSRSPWRPTADCHRPDVRRRGLPGRGRSVRRQHRRSGDAGGPDRQAEAALQAAARGDGGRPRRADQRADRADTAPGWSRLDHRAAGAGDQAARHRGRAVAALAVR